MENPFSDQKFAQKGKQSLVCMPFGWSTMIFERESSDSLFVTGYNYCGELGLGEEAG